MNFEATTPDGSTGISLRPVTTRDREFLLLLYASTSVEEYEGAGGREVELAPLVEQLFVEWLTDCERRYPDAHHNIVLVDNSAVGSILVARLEGEIRLVDLALLPEHRNMGIGTYLLRRLQDEAADSGKPLRHSVNKRNEAAVRFLARLGFQVVRDSDGSIVMEWIPST